MHIKTTVKKIVFIIKNQQQQKIPQKLNSKQQQ